MTTKIIGIKEFRKNMTWLWKEAREKNIRYIVMYHAKPILEVNPIDEEEFILENLKSDIAEARGDFEKGDYFTHEEVLEKLGL